MTSLVKSEQKNSQPPQYSDVVPMVNNMEHSYFQYPCPSLGALDTEKTSIVLSHTICSSCAQPTTDRPAVLTNVQMDGRLPVGSPLAPSVRMGQTQPPHDFHDRRIAIDLQTSSAAQLNRDTVDPCCWCFFIICITLLLLSLITLVVVLYNDM